MTTNVTMMTMTRHQLFQYYHGGPLVETTATSTATKTAQPSLSLFVKYSHNSVCRTSLFHGLISVTLSPKGFRMGARKYEGDVCVCVCCGRMGGWTCTSDGTKAHRLVQQHVYSVDPSTTTASSQDVNLVLSPSPPNKLTTYLLCSWSYESNQDCVFRRTLFF
jgi:hypothetical protein